jgi:hypothetical protein
VVGQPQGKRLLRRSRCKRKEDNIERDLKEIRWDGEDWIHLAQNRDKWRAFVDTVMIFRFA